MGARVAGEAERMRGGPIRIGERDDAALIHLRGHDVLAHDGAGEIRLPRIGEERVQAMYPIGSILRAGGRVVGGSDWPVSSANPLLAIETAVRRQDADESEGLILNEGERVSLAAMIDAYTINGAWLMHQDDLAGSIEKDKRADIVVLDRNLFDVPATEISDAAVVLTMLDGKIVYSSKAMKGRE